MGWNNKHLIRRFLDNKRKHFTRCSHFSRPVGSGKYYVTSKTSTRITKTQTKVNIYYIKKQRKDDFNSIILFEVGDWGGGVFLGSNVKCIRVCSKTHQLPLSLSAVL